MAPEPQGPQSGVRVFPQLSTMDGLPQVAVTEAHRASSDSGAQEPPSGPPSAPLAGPASVAGVVPPMSLVQSAWAVAHVPLAAVESHVWQALSWVWHTPPTVDGQAALKQASTAANRVCEPVLPARDTRGNAGAVSRARLGAGFDAAAGQGRRTAVDAAIRGSAQARRVDRGTGALCGAFVTGSQVGLVVEQSPPSEPGHAVALQFSRARNWTTAAARPRGRSRPRTSHPCRTRRCRPGYPRR